MENNSVFSRKVRSYLFVADNETNYGQFQRGNREASNWICGSELFNLKNEVDECSESQFIDLARSYIYPGI